APRRIGRRGELLLLATHAAFRAVNVQLEAFRIVMFRQTGNRAAGGVGIVDAADEIGDSRLPVVVFQRRAAVGPADALRGAVVLRGNEEAVLAIARVHAAVLKVVGNAVANRFQAQS